MKKKKEKKGGKTKAFGVGLEGFVDWTNATASEPTEKREDDMTSLTAGFATRMFKRAKSTQGETTPSSKVLGDKIPKWFGLDREVQNSLTIIVVDSSEQALSALLALSFSARLTNASPRKLKGPGRLVLNSPIILMKWEQPLSGALVSGPDTTQLIIDLWSPFN